MNIIGINGYIGSGKDEVGRIIQYLTTKKDDISYTGSYNSYLIDLGVGMSIRSEWQIKKFAGKLKQIACLLTGIPVHKFEDQEFKKTYLGDEWNCFDDNQTFHGNMIWGKRLMSVRELLQKLGTEAMRHGLHTNVWVNALFSDYHEKYDIAEKYSNGSVSVYAETSNWIITDCRFPNEAKAIKDRGGIMIRLNRNSPKIKERQIGAANVQSMIVLNSIKEQLHSSETSLDNYQFDYTIENNGTIEELIEKVKVILHERIN